MFFPFCFFSFANHVPLPVHVLHGMLSQTILSLRLTLHFNLEDIELLIPSYRSCRIIIVCTCVSHLIHSCRANKRFPCQCHFSFDVPAKKGTRQIPQMRTTYISPFLGLGHKSICCIRLCYRFDLLRELLKFGCVQIEIL